MTPGPIPEWKEPPSDVLVAHPEKLLHVEDPVHRTSLAQQRALVLVEPISPRLRVVPWDPGSRSGLCSDGSEEDSIRCHPLGPGDWLYDLPEGSRCWVGVGPVKCVYCAHTRRKTSVGIEPKRYVYLLDGDSTWENRTIDGYPHYKVVSPPTLVLETRTTPD